MESKEKNGKNRRDKIGVWIDFDGRKEKVMNKRKREHKFLKLMFSLC